MRAIWMPLVLTVLFQVLPRCGLAVAAPADKASEVVGHFQSILLSTMKDAKTLGFKGRYDRLRPAVQQNFYLSRIARMSIGRHWRSLDKQQKAHFIKTFSRLVIATYAHQFDGYAGEFFEIKSVQSMKRGRIFVRSALVKANGKRVHLDYVLQSHHGRWLIVNIVANGVSDLALKRVEYSSVLNRDGFDVLVAKLEKKIVQYE